jgi:hypothetical protein
MSGERTQESKVAGASQTYSEKSSPPYGQAKVGDSVVACKLSIQIKIEYSPSQWKPGAQPSRQKETEFSSFLGIDEKAYKINLDGGGVISRNELCSQSPTVFLLLPRFGMEGEALEYKGNERMEIGTLKAGNTYIVIVKNEVPEVAEFMVKEMLTNAQSQDAKDMASLNGQAAEKKRQAQPLAAESSRLIREQVKGWMQSPPLKATELQRQAKELLDQAERLKDEAMRQYRSLVDYDKHWDHKSRPEMKKWGTWHTWGRWEYYYDVWSNIHYGYVGRAAGFSREVLVKYASLAGRWNDFWAGKFKSAIRGDPSSDVIAILQGCEMYDTNAKVTIASLIAAFEQTPEFVRRPRSYNSNEQRGSIFLAPVYDTGRSKK